MLVYNNRKEMKRFNYIIILFAMLALSLTSCKKFLEKEPYGKISKTIIFDNVEGAQLALNGSYKLMLTYYRSEYVMYEDIASDNVISVGIGEQSMLPQFNFSSTSGDEVSSPGYIWLKIFQALNNINNVINALPDLKTKFPEQLATLEAIEGQALTMRALCHLDLSRVYAQPYNFTADASHLGVPILTKTPNPGAEVARSTVKEVYDQILTDLNTALPLLKKYNNTNQVVVNYQAALALLSRVYLYKGEWAASVSAANLVTTDNTFTLATAANYKSVFVNYPDVNPKVEMLFELTNNGYITVGDFDINNIFSDTKAGRYAASTKLLNSLAVDDIRKSLMFTPNAGNSLTKKYADGTITSTLTVKVIRLSEAYLNRAEANWNLGKYPEAAEDIRVIQQRARPSQTIIINYNSPADLYKQIADERNRELCFEGHRLFDIVRRKENLQRGGDCNSTVCSLTYPNNKFVLPITEKELDANKAMKQNPGY
jgi:tetratricopeptide (TPR) repeat protein